ncbi:helix-turn-helix transcriptional regulator [Isoptericola sp. JC619]|uniref:Helix-turn-helix transcriptional regulator n=2 Tax=Isoptericola sediminis TaxID=2733572 RepID=A0A849JU41_9MICO|nr:helix-turn-helix transcriptional regulator [Isoptericola sediminis]
MTMTSLDPAAPAARRTGTGPVVVAPWVGAWLARAAAGDPEAVEQLVAALRPAQLAGGSALPDPLPVVPALRARVPVAALDPEERRVLLCAALAVSGRAEVVLDAAGADAAVLARPVVADRLTVRDGSAALVDPGVRAALHAAADLSERVALHAALAGAARRVGETAAALWHTAVSTPSGDELLADGLLELADLLLQRGDASAAHRVAREAVSHAVGPRRAAAALLSGRCALWSGCLDDADRWLRDAAGGPAAGVARQAVRLVHAVATLRRGAPVGAGPTAPRHGGLDRPAAALARLVDPLVVLAPTTSDRTAMAAVLDALRLLDDDPVGADAALARTVVGAVPTVPRPGPWPVASGALTPWVEAHLRVVQSLVLVCTGDDRAAADVLADAAARLPSAHVVGGLAAELAGRLARERVPGAGPPVEVWRRIGPVRPAAAGTVAALLPGVVPPSGSLLAAAAARASGPGAPDGARRTGLPSAWSTTLTARELEVVEAVARGLTNRQVAVELSVSVRTVEVHLGRVFRKLDVSSRSELLVRALRPDA